MSRVFFAWVFFVLTCVFSTMILHRVTFMRRIFLEGVAPFEGVMK